MKILYDHSVFCRQSYGGVSRYFERLANELNQRPEIDATIRGFFHHNEYVENSLVSSASWKVPHFRGDMKILPKVNEAIYRFWPRGNPDIIHETYPVSRSRFPSDRIVVTIYDMIYEKFPEYFPSPSLPKLKRDAVDRSKIVLTISENSKRDIVTFCGVDPEKVRVTHLGVDPWTPPPARDVRLPTGNPYILFVGRRDKYKDFGVLLHAISDLKKDMSSVHLIAFGGGGVTPDESTLIHDLGLAERVHFMSGSDNMLKHAYTDALTLVFPSRYEGFGLPLLEAMSAGCPVICSDASSFPEVAGEAAWYFETGRADALAQRIEDLLLSPSETRRRVEGGFARVAHFTWKRCADATLAAYKELIG